MANIDTSQGVSNCYVFKSRLQEYSQKVGLPTPVYETIKEGPSHEPTFRSTVIVNDVRYDSLAGFFNRKAAEQSAAEVALLQLSQSGEMKECITQPVHETGLCKNLLQEYAQKMNYAVPLYTCLKDDKQVRKKTYSCTVEIGPIKYIGAYASTKKEAELKAARTALLAIQSSEPENSEYTVLPFKKKPTNSGVDIQETPSVLKPKKSRLKKKIWKKKKQQRHAAACDKHVTGENSNGSVIQVCSHNPTEPTNEACHGASVEGAPALEHFDVNKHVAREKTNDPLVEVCSNEEMRFDVSQHVDRENTNDPLVEVCSNEERCFDVSKHVDRENTNEPSVELYSNEERCFDVSKHVDRENTNDPLVEVYNNEERSCFMEESSFVIVKEVNESV